MTKLSTIRKQIAALEAQAARIAKEEMDSAIGKVKALMSEFGLTIEHLSQSVTGKVAAKKSKLGAKKAPAAAKYVDPKTGKTWSGFGRAPGWIAGAENRDAFLVDKSGIKPAEPAVKAPAASKKATVKVAKAAKVAKKAVKPAGKRLKEEATTAAAKAAGKAAATKDVGVEKVATKKAAKPKVAAKKSAVRKARAATAATTPAESTATAA